MPSYRVTWEIDVEDDSPLEAAKKALSIQRDPDSIATVFAVVDEDTGEQTVMDLLEGD